MSTNQVQDGKVLSTANDTGALVAAGAVLIAGAGIRVCVNDIADGASGPAYAEGVHTLAAKSADTWDDGDVLYWNETNSNLTTTAGANVQAGHGAGDKAALATTANVKLQPGATDYTAGGSGSGS